MTFQSFSLHPQLLEALEQHGIRSPTPIQNLAIGPILEGHDIQACAQTGTGKTLAFLLPALHRLTSPTSSSSKGPRALILVPTRELAEQVAGESVKFSCHLRKMKTVCIYGGMPYPAQKRMLSRPYEVLVATPGRLIDWIEQGAIEFSRLELLILDEADRMLDMGFADDVKRIASSTPKARQTLLFSATLKGRVLELSHSLLNSPVQITAEGPEQQHATIEQRLYHVDDLQHKNKLLEHFLRQDDLKQAIIFTATKAHADRLADELSELEISCAALHGDMSQRQRARTLDRLRQGSLQVLIATDVAARGVHVQDLSHVINFDLPFRVEDYVHRIGRTGRAGAHGVAITLANRREGAFLRRIEEYTGHKMAVCQVEGLEPKQRAHSSPRQSPSKRPYGGSRDPQRSGFDERGHSRHRKEHNFSRPPRGRRLPQH